jgi:hypothetical protein
MTTDLHAAQLPQGGEAYIPADISLEFPVRKSSPAVTAWVRRHHEV